MPTQLGDPHSRPDVAIEGPWGYCNTSGRRGVVAVIWIMSGLKRSRVRFAPPSSAAGRDARQQHHGETEGRGSVEDGGVVGEISPISAFAALRSIVANPSVNRS